MTDWLKGFKEIIDQHPADPLPNGEKRMTTEEIESHLGELLEQARDLQIKVQAAYRLVDDSPKAQRVSEDRLQALEALDKLVCALIRSKRAIQPEKIND